jgi:hypothetical protein
MCANTCSCIVVNVINICTILKYVLFDFDSCCGSLKLYCTKFLINIAIFTICFDVKCILGLRPVTVGFNTRISNLQVYADCFDNSGSEAVRDTLRSHLHLTLSQ